MSRYIFVVFLVEYMLIRKDFVQQKEEKEDPKKRGASPKGSAKSKGSGKDADQEPTTEGEPVPDEKYWPVSCHCWCFEF